MDHAPDAEIRQAVTAQLEKLEHDEDVTSTSNYYMAQNWERLNAVMGWGITGLAASVALIGALPSDLLGSYQQTFTTILAALAAGLGAVITNVQPSKISASFREFGNKRKELRNRIRVTRSVDLLLINEPAKMQEILHELLRLKNALNADNPPIPLKAFTSARRLLKDRQSQKG